MYADVDKWTRRAKENPTLAGIYYSYIWDALESRLHRCSCGGKVTLDRSVVSGTDKVVWYAECTECGKMEHGTDENEIIDKWNKGLE